MSKPTIAWFHSLTESVFALGAAAREYRTANQAVRVASWHTDPIRLLPVDGTLSVPGAHFVRPHDDALWRLGDLYTELESRTKDLFENTALAYAYGTAAALQSVLKGERPAAVEMRRDRRGAYVPPDGLLPDLREALDNWVGSNRLADLRHDLINREHACGVAEDFAACDDLADHEAYELTSASEFAVGLADAAYAYGEHAESALHFLLIAARANHIPRRIPSGDRDRQR